MATAVTAAFAAHRIRRPLWRVDTAAVASVLLAALTCLLGVYAPFNGDESAPAIDLPFTRNQSSGCTLLDGPGIVISAGADRRIYFKHDNRSVQTETVRRVAARHGIRLDARQLAELRQLAYIGLEVQQLPQYLALPPQERQHSKLLGIPNDSSSDELAEYVAVSRAVTLNGAHYSPAIVLELDKNLSIGTVKRIMHTLRQQGIRQCYYVAWLP